MGATGSDCGVGAFRLRATPHRPGGFVSICSTARGSSPPLPARTNQRDERFNAMSKSEEHVSAVRRLEMMLAGQDRLSQRYGRNSAR